MGYQVCNWRVCTWKEQAEMAVLHSKQLPSMQPGSGRQAAHTLVHGNYSATMMESDATGLGRVAMVSKNGLKNRSSNTCRVMRVVFQRELTTCWQ